MTVDADAAWLRHRGLVFSVAYDILGTVADAEDVAQETWIRFSAAAATTDIRNERAYLARIAARLALNVVRTVERRREDYVGPWLPEPRTAVGIDAPDDPSDAAIMADEVSMALLVVLQSLGAEERVAFVLREVFDVDYPEIAQALDRTPAATRQLVHRARERVRAQRPRREVTPAEHAATVERFGRATASGEIDALLEVLAPDVVLVSDGGGKAWAARKPVVGATAVATFLAGLMRLEGARSTAVPLVANGRTAVTILQEGVVVALFQYDVTRGQDGDRITAIHVLRDPEKLARLQPHRTT
ncbi:MAG: sigma-70 family RNA polymerase sigma factor [Chloroflexi bacterium]|nr:sigma-70 family RNA polymerase sigma factor [Chloroflexota bacterium]